MKKMSSLTLLYQLPECIIDEIVREQNMLVIRAHTTHPSACCPHCQQVSTHIHSRHQRSVGDLPVSDQAVRVMLQM